MAETRTHDSQDTEREPGHVWQLYFSHVPAQSNVRAAWRASIQKHRPPSAPVNLRPPGNPSASANKKTVVAARNFSAGPGEGSRVGGRRKGGEGCEQHLVVRESLKYDRVFFRPALNLEVGDSDGVGPKTLDSTRERNFRNILLRFPFDCHPPFARTFPDRNFHFSTFCQP